MINVAVIGTGSMGKHHVRNYYNIPNANLVAACDIDEEVGTKIASEFSCKYYKDYKEMLDNENIDALSIVVPTKFHKEVSLYALNKGKHVLLEKPIADDLESAGEIIKKAKEKNLKLMVGHVERFNPAVIKLKEIVDQGKLGKVISIIARRVGPFPPRMKGSSVIIDSAVHDIDVMNYLLNKTPNKTLSHGISALGNTKDDCAEIFLRYGDVSGFIQVNWVTPIKIRNLSVTGTLGYAELDYITQKLVVHERQDKKEFSNFSDVVEFAKPLKREVNIENEEPLSIELKSFIGCIENDVPPMVDGEDGLKVLRIAIEATENLN